MTERRALARGPFDRFDERARRVFAVAKTEATLFRHNYIGSEHLLLAAQVTRCLSAAWELFFLEYDTQPLALARLAGEYTLLIQYLETHRDEASAWLDPGAPTPMTAGEIAKRLEREGVETFPQSVRELLHRFSHQDTRAIGLTLSVKDSKKGQESWTLRIGDPSQNLRLVGSFLLIQDSTLLVPA
jgi:hypothetical protein